MAKLPNFLVIIRSEKLSGKGQGRGVGVRKKERFVLGKRTFRSQKSKHFVLRIIQLPSYTKTKGLDKERLRQMVLQYLSNAGEEGAKLDSIYEYLKDVLPANKTEEQQLRYVGRLLVEMNEENSIDRIGLRWILK